MDCAIALREWIAADGMSSIAVKDVDFGRGLIRVRSGKGDKDRVTMLPACLHSVLREQLKECRALWEGDRAAKLAGVWLPDALDRKFPTAGEQWAWFWLWPSPETSIDPRSRLRRRHHLIEASELERLLGDVRRVRNASFSG